MRKLYSNNSIIYLLLCCIGQVDRDSYGELSLELNIGRRPASGGMDGTLRGNN